MYERIAFKLTCPSMYVETCPHPELTGVTMQRFKKRELADHRANFYYRELVLTEDKEAAPIEETGRWLGL